jgi:catechol 2,3-dioxygenase-like lactoylglutathione lyase family enzyme
MSFRSALGRTVASLQPEYVRREPVGGRDAIFRFSVPVLRVRDVDVTVAWYRRHLGFNAESFPEHGHREFAILERDGVQILVRRGEHDGAAESRVTGHGSSVPSHGGWDLYIWADGVDLARMEAEFAAIAAVARPLSAMGSNMAELEVRDPDGYVLCIGGRTAGVIES